MTRYTPQWIQAGTYAASLDRRLIGALYPSGAITGCQVKAVGTGMDVTVDPGTVAVPASNGTGSVLCTSDAVETLTLDPAPPAGTDRLDLIICRPRSIDLDGVSTQEDFIFDNVTGASGAPQGTQPLAWVTVRGGAASIAAGDVQDIRFDFAVPTAMPAAWPPNHPGKALVAYHRATSAGQAIPTGAWTNLTNWTTAATIDLGGGSWDAATNSYVIPHKGLYLVNAALNMYLTGTTFTNRQVDFGLQVNVNGVGAGLCLISKNMGVLTAGTYVIYEKGSEMRVLNAGDKLSLSAYSYNAPASYTVNSGNTFLEVIELPHPVP